MNSFCDFININHDSSLLFLMSIVTIHSQPLNSYSLCIFSKISALWQRIVTPISSPIASNSSKTVPNSFSVAVISVIIIMLKYPCTIVWEMSKILILFSAKYVQTFAIIPTVSFPTTVIIHFFICCLLY